MFERGWKPGDWVIYRLSKRGVAPGPRAHHVSASRKGESYNYIVDKFWVIEAVGAEGELHVRTPGGKPGFCRAKTRIYAELAGGTGFFGASVFATRIKSDVSRNRFEKAHNRDRRKPPRCDWILWRLRLA